MHYTGTIWRPPYEADSLLLEVTAGCTHHKCKFCTLYAELPFKFRMSPLADVENDLLEARAIFKQQQARGLFKLWQYWLFCQGDGCGVENGAGAGPAARSRL